MTGNRALVLEEYGQEGLELIYSEYERDFPINERKSYLRLKELLSFGQYRLIIAKDTGTSRIKGYAIILKLFEYKAVWIDYIAVLRNIRGKGVGGELLSALKEYYEEYADVLFAEVELVDSPDPKERKIQEKRVCFYKSNGGLDTGLKYELPTCNGGLPMSLYYIPVRKGRCSDANQIKLSIAYLFKYVHKDMKNISEIYSRIFGEKLDLI